MAERSGRLEIEVLDADDDFSIDKATKELATQLRAVCDVSFPSLPSRPGDKAAGELLAATLNLVTGVDPVQIESLIRVLATFVRRHPERRVRLRIDDAEIEIENASNDQVDLLLKTFVTDVKRRRH
ncbi:hypothetical protein ACI2LF_23790 [Kribbella sp. NPDC020789]